MRGFTLIELLIVIGISSIFVAMSAGVYTTLRQRSNLELVAREVQSVFNLARDRTLASEGAQNFGVYVNNATREYFLFPGSSYSAGNPDNERSVMPDNINVLAPQFQGGGNEVVFNRLTGSTAQFGLVTLEDAGDVSRTMTLCVFSTGAVELKSFAQCGEAPIEHTGATTDADLANFPGRWGDPAQSFTSSTTDIYVREVQLYLRRMTTAPSDIYLEIRSGNTAGPVLGRSWMVKGSSLSASLGWVTFTFPTPVFLLANTQYFLRLRSFYDSTVYDPFNPSFSATGTIIWGYSHSALTPPAYSGGDAWRYVEYISYGGAGATGQRLGPADQYDFGFRVIYGIDPPVNADSRHVEFELDDPTNSNHDGWSIRGHTTMTLTFSDSPNPDVIQNIAMVDYFNSDQTSFDWQGSVDVNGDAENLRIHSLYIDQYDTILSIHRDRSINSKAVSISIDSRSIASYAADGTPTAGLYGGEAIYR